MKNILDAAASIPVTNELALEISRVCQPLCFGPHGKFYRPAILLIASLADRYQSDIYDISARVQFMEQSELAELLDVFCDDLLSMAVSFASRVLRRYKELSA